MNLEQTAIKGFDTQASYHRMTFDIEHVIKRPIGHIISQ